MMIVNNKKTAGKSAVGGDNNFAAQVQINTQQRSINLYQEHPSEIISLHEFHQIALNRLQALRKIEFM